ncbi:hypothetical protein JBL43_19695 [Aureibaculum sp. A20]|uniref:Uncharacterized protein n=1 Tax=Aureibaculum flavum TaxID=2795986 RepID=A0ABS0WWX4_9FLAO|nr:hypothetical protein [Aureibaculum flavum]MBJ2176484.1 hypothetical protein [Aureibaculum flavum]
MTDKEEKYYDRIKSNLIGQKIVEVFYEELKYETELEYWEYSNEIHSIDMNVIFQFESGKITQIKWDNEFYCYGIGFENLKEIDIREGIKTIRVSENPNWKNLIGKKISGINILWDISEGMTTEYYGNKIVKSEKTITKLPQTWELDFENSKIWISALEIKEDETDSFWADHLSVFFTNKGQEKYELVKKACTQHRIKIIAV